MTPVERIEARVDAAIARALQHAPESREALARLQGRRAVLRPRPVPASFRLAFETEGVRIRVGDDDAPDVAVEGTPLALLAMARGEAGADTAVTISGDLATAQALQALLRSLDVDWEALLAESVGEVTAHRLGRAGRGIARWLRASATALEQDVGEYLRNEQAVVAEGDELANYVASVDRLRDDLERLEARIRRLERGG